jgi:ergothioneine biosynthesis protein EgtB
METAFDGSSQLIPGKLNIVNSMSRNDLRASPVLTKIARRYTQTRNLTKHLCEPLEVEDFVVQSMPDVSPTRWHLAHTTWFFETFVLSRWEANYRPHSDDFQFLFNSYYNSVGEQFPRAQRGLLTRPTVKEVFAYREAVDQRLLQLLENLSDQDAQEAATIVELGINHEQQHQELMLTDIKHVLSCNPLWPIYRPFPSDNPPCDTISSSSGWTAYSGGVVEMGHQGSEFAFDNESPRHKVFLQPWVMQNRLVTNGEFLSFLHDDGYNRPELWLSLGWSTVREHNWRAPLYWIQQNGNWFHFTLRGLRPVNAAEPVCHVSFFEADAFARWSAARLPTEAEWEHAATGLDLTGSFLESENYYPQSISRDSARVNQLFGEVWQWTSSSYAPYPGYVPASGALGEYNGKFMCNQYVLRGGSCVTPSSHIRATYRNFFPADARWQFSGIRLVRDANQGE